MNKRIFAGVTSLALSAVLTTAPADAQSPSPEQFYKGNTFRIISGAGNASGYTIWSRFIGQFIGRHIPGNPTVIVDSMPGAGGMIATNYIYNAAPKDGREIALALDALREEGILTRMKNGEWTLKTDDKK